MFFFFFFLCFVFLNGYVYTAFVFGSHFCAIGKLCCNDRCIILVYYKHVALLFYVHGKHLRSCRDGQLT